MDDRCNDRTNKGQSSWAIRSIAANMFLAGEGKKGKSNGVEDVAGR